MRVLIVDDNEDKKPGLAPGASRYLLKPLKQAELPGEIESVLKEFETSVSRPAEPEINDVEYLKEDSERLALKLESRVRMLEEEIEKRKEVEAALRIEKERLESALKTKSEFLASMSHELKTPLISIMGFSQILTNKNSGELSDRQKHFIESIRKSGEFLLSLINNILDLSKIEAGKIELNIEKISLRSTIEETLTLFYEKALKHKIVIIKEFEPGPDLIEADKQRVKQILINLLSNAVNFSKEEGGTITVTVKKAGDHVQISVSDTGIGIKPENMGKLFGKFEQLEKDISKKYGGTGLGLAITKQLVELHGGRIWAESKYGKGSMFTFMLPLIEKKG
jgi:signal transduction histidine kinase